MPLPTFQTLSSFLFLSPEISVVLFLVSSIFFHVFISSYFKRAIRLASNQASLSILQNLKLDQNSSQRVLIYFISYLHDIFDLLLSSLLSVSQALHFLFICSLLSSSHRLLLHVLALLLWCTFHNYFLYLLIKIY